MFAKILIANRGEIACRVIDTARRLGVATVAVYSDADQAARHVAMADEAVHIGGPDPADSYLRGDVIIKSALDRGAQAIHPGYGFLSENPGFVEAVEAAGLVFIGPSADAIRAMGLKDAAKTLMEKSGVPVVPGYHGANQSAEFLLQAAEDIGFPVLIKAVAGGGGKGMRLVEQSHDFAQALSSARTEALSGFGNTDVLIEKFVEKPRHIEVQIFGDGEHTVHFYERDCSLQRRHQKVIEEAPAPGMTARMRAAMCEAAVRAAQAIGYSGAGTVEFIVDASGGLRTDRFWFMEMNTRLQVEHPVTEAVTGIDLVEWQLRVAAGESLPLAQADIKLNGHSIEARLYAEDPETGFLPAAGTLTHLKFPDHVRVDTGVSAGDSISRYYDPMIAKLIVQGATRKIALNRLSSALSGTEIAGTITNLTFLSRLARQPEFVDGDVDTGLIAGNIDSLILVEEPPVQAQALAALAASGLAGSASELRGFSLWGPLTQSVKLRYRDQDIVAAVNMKGPDCARVFVGGQVVEVGRVADEWQIPGGGKNMRARPLGSSVSIFGPTNWNFAVPDALKVDVAIAIADDRITAPMPGVIRSLQAQPGQNVVAGDRLVILEAMKMEHVLCAPRDGLVTKVVIRQNDQVDAGATLIILQEIEK